MAVIAVQGYDGVLGYSARIVYGVIFSKKYPDSISASPPGSEPTYYFRGWDPDNSRFCYWNTTAPLVDPVSVSPPAIVANITRKTVLSIS